MFVCFPFPSKHIIVHGTLQQIASDFYSRALIDEFLAAKPQTNDDGSRLEAENLHDFWD
jgi:hypothetical protein